MQIVQLFDTAGIARLIVLVGHGCQSAYNPQATALDCGACNTGDLRIELSRQSVHDGERWMHTPQRLSVFVDALREMIDDLIARHSTVHPLVDHQWLHIFRFADGGIERRHDGRWQPWEAESPAA